MEKVSKYKFLTFGPYVVDLAAGEVRKNGHRIRLQENPMRILVLLAEKQGEVVTREELQKRLWPGDTFVDFENGLNAAVSKLREAISDSSEHPKYIETIPRRGYRFQSPVEFVPANGDTNGSHSSTLQDESSSGSRPIEEAPAKPTSPPAAFPERTRQFARWKLVVLAGLVLCCLAGFAVYRILDRRPISICRTCRSPD